MVKIAVVYHSGYGHTEAQAKHVHKGAGSVDGVESVLYKVQDVTEKPEQLNEYDGIIFGSPTYMGSVSAPFKAFMDGTSNLWFKQQWKDKVAAGFTNSGGLAGDKFNTLVQLVTFAAQHSMIWVSLGLLSESLDEKVATGDSTSVNRIGSYLGAMAQSDNVSPDKAPPVGDLKTAELFGKRVAEITLRFTQASLRGQRG